MKAHSTVPLKESKKPKKPLELKSDITSVIMYKVWGVSIKLSGCPILTRLEVGWSENSAAPKFMIYTVITFPIKSAISGYTWYTPFSDIPKISQDRVKSW